MGAGRHAAGWITDGRGRRVRGPVGAAEGAGPIIADALDRARTPPWLVGAVLLGIAAAAAMTLAYKHSRWPGLLGGWTVHALGLGAILGVSGVGRLVAWRVNARVASEALLRAGRCGACGYPVREAAPESDGCVVCPECGAAWQLSKPPPTRG